MPDCEVALAAGSGGWLSCIGVAILGKDARRRDASTRSSTSRSGRSRSRVPTTSTRRTGRPRAEGRLLIQECPKCGHRQWYPRALCTACGADPEWLECSGRGTVHTFTSSASRGCAPFQDELPYVIAMVELDEGPLMFGNVTDCDSRRRVRSACRSRCGSPRRRRHRHPELAARDDLTARPRGRRRGLRPAGYRRVLVARLEGAIMRKVVSSLAAAALAAGLLMAVARSSRCVGPREDDPVLQGREEHRRDQRWATRSPRRARPRASSSSRSSKRPRRATSRSRWRRSWAPTRRSPTARARSDAFANTAFVKAIANFGLAAGKCVISDLPNITLPKLPDIHLPGQ